MEYTYYPGCSVHSSSPQYDESTQEVVKALGIGLHELDDWNCCGATAYMGIKEITAFSISARNLALASPLKRDIVTPCSGCYVVLQKTNSYMNEFGEVKSKVKEALAEAQLDYNGETRVRHLLEIFTEDMGFEKLKAAVKKPLTDLRVACYAGCQLSRPQEAFDDAEIPVKLDEFVRALGATPIHFPMRAACCSGSVIGTERNAGIDCVKNILDCADHYGAEVMVVACPLCQMNIDAYQPNAARKAKKNFNIPIIYFTQLLGLALGLDPVKLGFGKELVSADHIVKRYI